MFEARVEISPGNNATMSRQSLALGRRPGASSEPELILTGANTNTNVISKVLIQARCSGHLKLQSRGLTSLPPQCCDIGNVVLPDGMPWWETRETLETMDVSQNELRMLPDAIGSLEDLRELDATHNKIQALPPSLAELPSLKKLMLAHNQLVALPELGAFNLPPLVQLVASHNALSNLPLSLGGLADLIELDLSYNRLTTLPAGLGGMRALQRSAHRPRTIHAAPLPCHGPPFFMFMSMCAQIACGAQWPCLAAG